MSFWCGLHFWNCASLSLCRRALSLLISQWGKHTVGDGAHSGQIFMLSFIIVFIFFIFLYFCCYCRQLQNFLLLLFALVCVFLLRFYGAFVYFFSYMRRSHRRRRRDDDAKFKAALSSPYQHGRRRALNSRIIYKFVARFTFFFLTANAMQKKKKTFCC